MNCRTKIKKKKKKIFFFQSMMTKVSYLDNESLFFSKNFRKYVTYVQTKSQKISAC